MKPLLNLLQGACVTSDVTCQVSTKHLQCINTELFLGKEVTVTS